jgi:hypothetical protein
MCNLFSLQEPSMKSGVLNSLCRVKHYSYAFSPGIHWCSLLNPILDELVREGRIRITAGKDGDMVSLAGK